MFTTATQFVPLADYAAQFMLIVARLSFPVFFMPGIGEQAVPARVRVFLLLGLAVAFASTGVVGAVDFMPISNYLTLMLGEIFIGFVLGVSLRIAIWLLSIVGSIIAQSIGLSQFLGVALDNEAQTITANILSMAGVALLLTMNYHVEAFVALLGLYSDIPVGGYELLNQSFYLDSIFASLGFAVALAWPFVAVNLIYNICLGFINKALPQLMVAFVGAPFLVGAGLFMLAISVMSLLIVWADHVVDLVGWI